MTTSGGPLQIGSTDDDADVIACAAVWARATARRDDESSPRPVDQTLPGVRRRLAVPGAELVVVRQDGRVVGFTLAAPTGARLEMFYLGVDPDAWGLGVGSLLLHHVEEQARRLGHDELELRVIADNHRAVDVYTRAGWVDTGETTADPSTSVPHRRFVRSAR